MFLSLLLKKLLSPAQYTQPLIYTLLFYAFYFNVPCQWPKLLDLRLLIFGSTPFRWLRSICKTLISDGDIFYLCQLSYTPSISGRQLGRKTRDGCARNVNFSVCVGLIANAQQPENGRPRWHHN